MSESPRSVEQALNWFQAEKHRPFGSAPTPSGNWGGYCLMDCRISYAIPALFGSAWAAWLGADDEDKHPGSDPSKAPLGSALIFQGGSYGHIEIGARQTPTGDSGAWSNDLMRYGMLDHVPRTLATKKWGQKYVGYLSAINHWDLRLAEDKPAVPKQDKQYKGIERAIQKMENARDKALDQKDMADVKMIREELARLRKMYRTMRHA